MAGKPGSREEDALAKKHLKPKAQESRLVKAQRAYLPREGQDDYIEGSE